MYDWSLQLCIKANSTLSEFTPFLIYFMSQYWLILGKNLKEVWNNQGTIMISNNFKNTNEPNLSKDPND